MDYDADGTLDFISGSYDPGDVYLFRGFGAGKYAARATILDETGTPLVHHPEELKKFHILEHAKDADKDETIQARVASFGSWPAPVDWDGDGDLDMLIGSFEGTIYLRSNTGSRSKPVFSSQSIEIHDDAGNPLRVSGHADPFPADWDGDGHWDLVVGSSTGRVCWYRNVGSDKQPKFGASQELVPAKSTSKFLTQYLEPDQTPSPGVRAQVCVVDYNGDGLLDLLMGDYSSVERLRKLDENEHTEFERLRKMDADVIEQLLQLGPKAEEREKLAAQHNSILEEMKQFVASHPENQAPSSFIWLFRRNPGQATPRGTK